ncbi:hypothetical protein KSP39_PZI003401 [Platanthera zijinensis]|uniref:Uncharacterized protein n=1 Tax=Platanthera zijinensis TaxID=2320716 RepID=A0AAP0BWA1_9ASPA
MAFNPSHCIRPFSSNRTSPSSSADPSSPKVGCMGQVRRCKSTSTVALPQHPKHHGGRSLYFLVASAAFLFVSPINRSRRPKAKKTQRVAVKGSRVASVEDIDPPLPVVAVEELDPPLPVAAAARKERAARGADQVSLWKRRCRSGKLDELFFCKPERLPAVIAELVV